MAFEDFDPSQQEFIIKDNPLSPGGQSVSFNMSPEEYEHRRNVLAAATRTENNALDNLTTEQLGQLAYLSTRSGEEREQDLLTEDAATRFVEDAAETLGYKAVPYNGALMQKEIKLQGLDPTRVESYYHAFESLKEQGLADVDAEAANKFKQEVRQEQRARRVGSRVNVMSAKRSYEPEPVATQPNFDRMSTDELMRLAYADVMRRGEL